MKIKKHKTSGAEPSLTDTTINNSSFHPYFKTYSETITVRQNIMKQIDLIPILLKKCYQKIYLTKQYIEFNFFKKKNSEILNQYHVLGKLV